MLVKNDFEMKDLDKTCILVQMWSISDEKYKCKLIIKIWRYQNSFYEGQHFEYLMRLYNIIKP